MKVAIGQDLSFFKNNHLLDLLKFSIELIYLVIS